MNYAEIRKLDSANGPGIRVSLFVSGCEIKCPGCFNKELQDFNYGKQFTEETIKEILEYLSHPHVRGLTILGGEPLSPSNVDTVWTLVKRTRFRFPDKDIWCYTGYKYEDLLNIMNSSTVGPQDFSEYGISIFNVLNHIDVLVDGPFIQESKHPGLQFRGSSNQRIIDISKSKKQNEIVLSDKYK